MAMVSTADETVSVETAPPTDFAAGLTHGDVRRILGGVMLAMFLAALDQTIIVTALPTIADELAGTGLSWVVTAYLLAATTTALLYGRFSDTHGRRPALFLAVALFTVGSIACALSTTMPELIAARALQGIGAGGLIAIPMTVMGDMISPAARGRYQGYVASVYATSSLAGPLLGGFIADYIHWSFVFWINVPLAVVAIWVAGPRMDKLPRNHRRSPLDLWGAAFVAISTVSILLVLSWTGPHIGWVSLPSFGLLAFGIAAAFVLHVHLNRAEAPLIPLGVLRNAVVRNAALAGFFAFGAFIGLCVMAPLYFELARGYSPSASGVAVIPLMVATVVGATLSGRAMPKVAHYKHAPLAGLALAMGMSAVLAFTFHLLPDAVFAMLLGAISFGIGTLLPVITVSVQNAVPVHEMGVATATGTFFRQMGAAFMVALFGALTVGSVEVAAAVTGDLVAGYRAVFATAALVIGIAIIFLWRMDEIPLRTAST